MIRIFHRIQSYFTPTSKAQDHLEDMLIELRSRGIHFQTDLVEEDGERYFLAKSVNYPRGAIVTSGNTVKELEDNLKDAIFTAFEIPPKFCHPSLININGPLFTANRTTAQSDKQLVHVTT